jgi:chromate transporter
MVDPQVIISIGIIFGQISLMAFGGGNAVLPEIHRQAVDINHWLTEQQFVSAFTISEIAPGPSTLLVTLIGWTACGPYGAVVATLAMLIPSSLLVLAVAQFWRKNASSPWRNIFEQALAPVALGLILSGGLRIVQTADHTLVAYLITLGSALAIYRLQIHPLLCIGIGGALGILGFVSM